MPRGHRTDAQRQRDFSGNPQRAALEWVKRSLFAEDPSVDVSQAENLARGLIALAEQRAVPIEILVEWIHRTKIWTLAEFRGFAFLYASALREQP
jgi:hypothetical protein